MAEIIMTQESIKEFQDNLKKVSDFSTEAMVKAMNVACARVANSAKANHKAAPKDGSHPDPRYYDRTAKLTNSVRIGDIEASEQQITGEVKAGDGSEVAYAAKVEFQYPFMQPALQENADPILFIFAETIKQVIG